MKKIFFGILMIVSVSTFAQKLKVDLDHKYFTYEYVELPQVYTDPSNRTFNVITSNSSDYHYLYDNDVYGRKIAINGFTRTSSAPYITIEVGLDPAIDMGSGVQTSNTKRADGTIATSYHWRMAIKGTGRYSVNYGGKVTRFIISREFSTNSTNNFNTYNDANSNYSSNQRSNKELLLRQFVDYSIQTIYDNINSLYGYRIKSENENVWILDSKENPEYNNHQDALAQLRTNFASLTYNSNPQSTYSLAKPQIDYFEQAKTYYTEGDDKKHKKMRYASFYNLMKIYFALEMYDKAMEEANKLVANDYDIKDGEQMIKRINDLKARLAINNSSTTHVNVNPIYVR
jgi:hypothetical protein